MLRLALYPTRLATCFYHTTSALRMPPPYHPQDWAIIEESPNGFELTFSNGKTGEATFYTPEGMTAEEILAVPGAKKYWRTTKEVEKYIKEKSEEKIRSGGVDYKTQE